MSDTIEPMSTNGAKRQPGERQDRQDLQALAAELVERATTEGVELIGPGGLLTGLTKTVLETVLETVLDVELTEHLGYDKHDPAGRRSGNSRNGTRPKTVLTELGPVEVDVPRDRAGTFEPVIVKKGQRRLDGIDQIVLSLTARGLRTGVRSARTSPRSTARPSARTPSPGSPTR